MTVNNFAGKSAECVVTDGTESKTNEFITT